MRTLIFLLSLCTLHAQGNELLKDYALNLEKYKNSCDKETEPNLYESVPVKKLALANFKAQAQYFALKKILIYVSDAAKNLSFPRQQHVNTIKTIIQKQCSAKMTILSKSSLEDLAIGKYDESTKVADYTRSDYVEGLKLLGDFCSWQGLGYENSMISYRLKDPLVAETIIKDYVESKNRVLCDQLKCRLTDKTTFLAKYKGSKNKPTFESEIRGLYCFNIKKISHSSRDLTDQYTKERLKESPESLKRSELFLYASFLNFPAPSVLDDWDSNTPYFFSKVIESEKNWSEDLLRDMSKKVEMEEKLSVRFRPNEVTNGLEKIKLDLDIYGDEFDKLVHNVDKLSWKFTMNMKKEDLLSIISKIDSINLANYSSKKEMMDNLIHTYTEKIRESFWDPKLSKVPTLKLVPNLSKKISEALIQNLTVFRGLKAEFVSEQKPYAEIPVNISFGWEALRKLSQLRRLDIK